MYQQKFNRQFLLVYSCSLLFVLGHLFRSSSEQKNFFFSNSKSESRLTQTEWNGIYIQNEDCFRKDSNPQITHSNDSLSVYLMLFFRTPLIHFDCVPSNGCCHLVHHCCWHDGYYWLYYCYSIDRSHRARLLLPRLPLAPLPSFDYCLPGDFHWSAQLKLDVIQMCIHLWYCLHEFYPIYLLPVQCFPSQWSHSHMNKCADRSSF